MFALTVLTISKKIVAVNAMTFPLLMAITSSEEQPASFFKFFFFDLNGVEKDMFFGEFNGAAYINLTHMNDVCFYAVLPE